MPINMTILTNSSDNSIIGVGEALNIWTSGLFGFTLLIAIYIILFVITSKAGIKNSFATTAFIGAIITIFMRLIGWINGDMIVMVSISFVVIGGISLFLQSQDTN